MADHEDLVATIIDAMRMRRLPPQALVEQTVEDLPAIASHLAIAVGGQLCRMIGPS